MSEPADFDSWQALSAGKWRMMERAASRMLREKEPIRAAVAFDHALAVVYPLAPFEKRAPALTWTQASRLNRFTIIAAVTARHFEEREKP